MCVSADGFPREVRAITDALPDGVVVHDPHGGILYANAAFVTLVGARDEAELIGRPVLDLVHPEDRAAAVGRMRELATTDAALLPRAFRFLRPGGEVIEAECRAVRYRAGLDVIVAVARDLTERQHAAESLARSEALFRSLIHDLSTGVLVQGPKAEILVSNRAALELLGLDESQLLGKTSFDPDWNAIHEDGSPFPGADHPVPTAIRTKRPVRGVVMGVYRPRKKDRVWLSVDAQPQLDREGEVAQVVCTFNDFTEHRRAHASAIMGDRLTSMGRLAAGVAHEINNPLAYVTINLDELAGFVARIASREALAPAESTTLRDLVEGCRDGVGRVRAIVNDLRSLSRGDDDSSGAVDLQHVIDTACNIVSSQLRHRARLVRDLQPMPLVEGNEARLGQLFLNLLMNAAEAIPEGHARDNEVRVSSRVDESGAVVIEVRDTGAGIPADVLERIFDPFFTTKPVGVGTGLGLAICHDIARSCGGTIEAQSEPGRGATFRVRLRACPHSPAARPETVTPAIPRSKILILDDEPLVARALATILGEDHEVHVESRAAALLERLQRGESFDVLFCDLMMPDMTGMDLQAALEREAPAYARRTVFMTGGAFTPRAQAFLASMEDRVLEKPFRRAAVDDAIVRIRRGG